MKPDDLFAFYNILGLFIVLAWTVCNFHAGRSTDFLHNLIQDISDKIRDISLYAEKIIRNKDFRNDKFLEFYKCYNDLRKALEKARNDPEYCKAALHKMEEETEEAQDKYRTILQYDSCLSRVNEIVRLQRRLLNLVLIIGFLCIFLTPITSVICSWEAASYITWSIVCILDAGFLAFLYIAALLCKACWPLEGYSNVDTDDMCV